MAHTPRGKQWRPSAAKINWLLTAIHSLHVDPASCMPAHPHHSLPIGGVNMGRTHDKGGPKANKKGGGFRGGGGGAALELDKGAGGRQGCF